MRYVYAPGQAKYAWLAHTGDAGPLMDGIEGPGKATGHLRDKNYMNSLVLFGFFSFQFLFSFAWESKGQGTGTFRFALIDWPWNDVTTTTYAFQQP